MFASAPQPVTCREAIAAIRRPMPPLFGISGETVVSCVSGRRARVELETSGEYQDVLGPAVMVVTTTVEVRRTGRRYRVSVVSNLFDVFGAG